MPHFNLEEKNLMLIQGLVYFAGALAGIFVTVYFFAHSDIKTTLFYNIVMIVSLTFFYALSGLVLRRFSSALLIRIGLFTGALFYLLLFLLADRVVDFVVLLGIVNGFSGATYWAGFNLNQYAYTNRKTRVEYFGSMTGILNLLQAVAPLIGGMIISLSKSYHLLGVEAGYLILFFIVFLLYAITALVVGNLPSHEVLNFSYRHIISHRRSRLWKLVLWQQLVLGLYDLSLGTVVSVLLYLIVKGELLLGITQGAALLMGTVGSFVSILLLGKNRQFLWVGAVGVALGIGVFALFQNWNGLWVYVLLTGFCAPFLYNWFAIVSFGAMDAVEASWKEKFHLIIERDSVLGAGRIASYALLLFFLNLGNQVTIARHWLLVIPILPLVLGWLLSQTRLEPQVVPEV